MHKISNINKTTKQGICSLCGEVDLKFRRTKNRWECMTLVREERKRYRTTHPERHRRHAAIRRWRRKGIELPDYIWQHYLKTTKCDICGEETNLVIDHDHNSGKIRGFLCQKCNRGLGLFNDSTMKLGQAITYLNIKKLPICIHSRELPTSSNETLKEAGWKSAEKG